jgi:uroporphyrinogen decarboxylase
MDSRERTFLALAHQQPDCVPIDLWASSSMTAILERAWGLSWEALLDAHDVDLRYIPGPRYVGPPLRSFADGTTEDVWGVRRTAVTVAAREGSETYQEGAWSPLAAATSVEEIEAYDHWPSADWFDCREIAQQCLAVRNRGRVAVFMGDRLNRIAQLKPAMYLRGVERILEDMALRPELAQAIFTRIRAFYCAYLERILDASQGKLDILLTGDDFGAQNGPLISPRMWVEFLGQGFAQYVALAKAQGVCVMHHTCGAVRPLLPLLIERGLDVLQSLQPEAAGMEAQTLKAEFGQRLAFHGGVSIQRTLPWGTPEEVRCEVRQRVEALAPGGGYILCTSHNIQADVPLANVQALLEAYRMEGRY